MRYSLFFLLVVFAFSCDSIDNVANEQDDLMVWVKVDLRLEPRDDSIGLWHCGQIAFKELMKIRKGKKVDLLSFENVRYWSNNDKVELYEDEEEYGYYFLDPELIVRMSMLKKDPVAYEPDSVLSDRALEYRAEHYDK